ncbi:hypothetical protein B0H13DRAFT_1903303 [Mycena leptocephala]|nr:hypothetical protein B0H13DRAFT_1903303 [Mycena leptocephala]
MDRNVKPKTAAKEFPFTLVLMPHTKAVARGKRKVPTPQQLISLDEEGYVQNVSFAADATAEDIANTTQDVYWQDLLRDIIERFPHPDVSRRLTMDALLAPGVTRVRQYHMLPLIYHVDRNVAETAHFRAVAAIISQVLNDTRNTKLDAPKIVPFRFS